MWLEEMLPQDNLAAYQKLADTTRLTLCLSERLMTRYGFRELFENRAAGIIMPDICWCGGISEAKKIASMAETYYLPVAPHNWWRSRFCTSLPARIWLLMLINLNILESVRRHYRDEYRGILTRDLVAENGEIPLPPGPGLGVELDPGVALRSDAKITVISK